MTSVHHDSRLTDDERRSALYRGDIFLSSPDPATRSFCEFTRGLVAEAFGDLDPERAQAELPLARYVEILSELKPRFIHHPDSKRFIRDLLETRGCDLGQTYFDVPRLRSSTSDGYLTTGIAYAWHPHRDTWYSAPLCQLNFWMPIYPIVADNAMAFHQDYFTAAVPNTSAGYNYYEWNRKFRASAAANVGVESRPLPAPVGSIDMRNPLVFVPDVGGVIEFSGQHLHSSVPNNSGRTRFSIDFRTVHVGDIELGRGAPNVDVACTGSSIRDFMRASDCTPIPDHIVELFEDGTEARGDLLYDANRSAN